MVLSALDLFKIPTGYSSQMLWDENMWGKYVGKIQGENMSRKYFGKICGNYVGKICGEKYSTGSLVLISKTTNIPVYCIVYTGGRFLRDIENRTLES